MHARWISVAFPRLLIAGVVALLVPHRAVAEPLDCGGVGGTIRQMDLQIPSRNGEVPLLEARLFAPDPERQTAPCPLVALLPGGGANNDSVTWAGQRLAAKGYVAMVADPEPRSGTDDYHNAAVSIIDFMTSADNPVFADTDIERIGGAGWSLGARTWARTQEEDLRVDAVVGWDHMAKSESGDDGSPLCTNSPNPIRTPRVPALGEASETCGSGLNSKPADAKQDFWRHWRDAGVPAMAVVFAGCGHFCWSADGSSDAQKDLNHYYTQAWFDRFLKDDESATDRLLAREALGRPLEEILSCQFFSAVSLDEYDCNDLRSMCGEYPEGDCGASPPPPTPGPEGTCAGLPATIVGTDGPDVINAGPGDDVILGLGGDDVIRGNAGNDIICAGPGNDIVYGGAGDDLIFGEGGNDLLLGGSGQGDRHFGGDGVDACDGETNDETCEVGL